MYSRNKIHPSAIIIGDVEMGVKNEILPYSVLIGPLELGDGNWIGPHVTIGTPGQDTRNPRYDSSSSRISIGDDNIIREYTAIQKPCYKDLTSIGSKCFLMQGVHIPHDAIIEDEVVVTPMVVCGGIVRIMQGANLGLSCSLHQYTVIGQYAIVGMGSAVTKNIKPFSRFVPGKPLTVNKYAIEKFGFHNYEQEIAEYVLKSAPPETDKIREIVGDFERYHKISGRGLY